MRQKVLNEKVKLLLAGQSVELNADWFRAVSVVVESAHERCDLCDLDCLCVGDVAETCEWLNVIAYKFYCLKLAHK